MPQYISKAAAILGELLENGTVSASLIDRGSQKTNTLFSTLVATGIIKKQRSHGGNCYQLLHLESLHKFIESEFPSGLLKPSNSDTANRTYGVLTQSDSKVVTTLGFDLIMLRGNTELSINETAYLLDNSDVAFLSLKISPTQAINIEKNNAVIVTIENPTVFIELNKVLDMNWDVAVYTAGKISTLLLEQLQQWHTAGHKLIHFGDYDYVGLLEYARILAHCPQAQLYFPTRLTPEFIKQYGKAELHEKQIMQHQTLLKELQKLPNTLQKQQLTTVYTLLQSTAKGLEQEAFLIS